MLKNTFILSFLLFITSLVFPVNIWITVDKSQEENMKSVIKKYIPNANIKAFYWENALGSITNKIKNNEIPDILLTGHTYVPFIAQYYTLFKSVQPIFWDVRALYVWKNDKSLRPNNWSDAIFYLQNNTNFMCFPKTWNANNFYNYLSFFNDQLPFWVSQSPFTTQNMIYTLRLLATLKNTYPTVFKENPIQSFLQHETQSIISGLWMYNMLKKDNKEFAIYPVPKSQNGIAEFKGAYVAINFNKNTNTQKAKSTLTSFNFQKDTWELINLLPVNKELQTDLEKDPILKRLLNISKSSQWASSVDPTRLKNRIEVLNYLLNKDDILENFDEKELRKFFNNRLYFTIMKTFK